MLQRWQNYRHPGGTEHGKRARNFGMLMWRAGAARSQLASLQMRTEHSRHEHVTETTAGYFTYTKPQTMPASKLRTSTAPPAV